MPVDFTFANSRSFRDEKTLSMETSSGRRPESAVIRKGPCIMLPAAVMLGYEWLCKTASVRQKLGRGKMSWACKTNHGTREKKYKLKTQE